MTTVNGLVTIPLMAAALLLALGASGAIADMRTDQLLLTRGLIGRSAPSGQSAPRVIKPPDGVEVQEARQIAKGTGEEVQRTLEWNEVFGSDLLHVQMTTYPTGQYGVAFWILPVRGPGCSLYGWTMYSQQGAALHGDFWRNDPGLRIPGSAKFPSNLYPDSIPTEMIFRSLDPPHDGAAGKVHFQMGPYGYVGLDVWIKDTEQVTTQAGTFSAFKVYMRPNIRTFFPAVPEFVLGMIQPFLPKSVAYYQSEAPYRFLKGEGTATVGGPETVTEVTRYYIASAPKIASAAKPAS
jgi:hypothetical protein